MRKRMSEFDSYIAGLAADEVGVLEPEGEESVRAISMRLSRAGTRTQRPVEVWHVNGKVYVKLKRDADPRPAKRRLELGKAL